MDSIFLDGAGCKITTDRPTHWLLPWICGMRIANKESLWCIINLKKVKSDYLFASGTANLLPT
jgi:hypothetical protein